MNEIRDVKELCKKVFYDFENVVNMKKAMECDDKKVFETALKLKDAKKFTCVVVS